MKKPTVLVVGDIIIDEYHIGEVHRTSPEAPVPVLLNPEVHHMLGGAANVAANMAKMGCDVTLLGVTGCDPEFLLDAAGFRMQFTRLLEPSIFKRRYIARHPRLQHIVRVDVEQHNRAKYGTEAVYLFQQLQAEFDGIVVCDYLKGTVTPELLNLVSLTNSKLFYDCKPQSPPASSAFTVKMNLSEAREYTGHSHVQDIAEGLAAEYDESVVTMGENGMMVASVKNRILRRLESSHFDATCKSPVDVSGAGDTVMAAYATMRLLGRSIRKSGEAAMVAAGKAVSQLGTAVVGLK